MKEIRLLKPDFKTIDGLYEAFKNNNIKNNDTFLTNDYVTIEDSKFFPMYLAKYKDNKEEKFIEACKIIEQYYGTLDREYTLDGRFWYSLLLQEFAEEIMEEYPQVLESEKQFQNIVLKKFDWENYIYKSVLISQAIWDNISDPAEQEYYLRLVMQNLDVVNYVIKYVIFRNDTFLIKILTIIDKYNISKIAKGKFKKADLKGRPAEHLPLGKDERYGRRVIFEFNKAYPVLMVPMLSDEELEEKFFEYLNMYYDVSTIDSWINR